MAVNFYVDPTKQKEANRVYKNTKRFPDSATVSENIKKREEGLDPDVNYGDSGGLPKRLRYPFSAIEDGMDFLKISIATYSPPRLNLEG